MSVEAAAFKAAQVTQGATADNAVASATVAAAAHQKHGMVGVHADYSAAPSAGYKTITVKRGADTLIVFRHDFAQGAFLVSLPAPLWGRQNEAVSVELQASGTLGVTGRVALFHFAG